jgi:protein involved in polysaccharide export with SLBB domain
MTPAQGRSLGWIAVLALICGLQAGCGIGKDQVDQSLLAHRPPEGSPARLAELYVVRFPDVLDVRIADQPALSGERPLAVDGRIDVAPGEGLRVEGKMVRGIARALADQLNLPVEDVQVSVSGFNSQRLFLQGEVKGETRAVPYVGAETVLDMLQRVGGITSGAVPTDIQVVRAHVAEGRPPEVFNVDLDAILIRNDNETNIKLQPFDQVYVGQSRRSSIKESLPPWLRPAFGKLFGLSRPDDIREPLLPNRPQGGLVNRSGRRYTPPPQE